MPAATQDDKSSPFTGLYKKVKERLETFANLQILEADSGDVEYSYRIGHHNWQPVGLEDVLPRGHWRFCEFNKPLLFRFHLPSKLQESVWSWPSAEKMHRAEDFVVAYDGMIFLAAAELPEQADTFSLPPTVRAYLQRELLSGIPDFTPAVIPPSPLHLRIALELKVPPEGEPVPANKMNFDSSTNSILITHWGSGKYDLQTFAGELCRVLSQPLREFYHLMIDMSIANNIHQEILIGSESTYSAYEELLDVSVWRPIKKMRLHKELSREIAALQYSFCQHYLAAARFEESRTDFLKTIANHSPLNKAAGYFEGQTKASRVDYSVFGNSLEHMGTHVLSLIQNRYLMYAALLGSAITLVGTVIGYLVSKK